MYAIFHLNEEKYMTGEVTNDGLYFELGNVQQSKKFGSQEDAQHHLKTCGAWNVGQWNVVRI